jgi:hypothetical protein
MTGDDPAWHELVRATIDALPTTEEPVADDDGGPARRAGERVGAWLVCVVVVVPVAALVGGLSWRLFRWVSGL